VSEVLRVLDDAYAGIPQSVLETAAARGEALHRLCLSYLASLDGVHEEPVPTPPYEAAYNAFTQWVRVHAVLVVAIEEPSVNATHGYRGTPDALVLYQGEEVLIDLKFTAAILRTNKVQVQAYRKLDHYKTAKKALLIHIHPVTGDLKVHPVPNNPHDWAAFLNALNVLKWRTAK
jgi:hypothetical protein